MIDKQNSNRKQIRLSDLGSKFGQKQILIYGIWRVGSGQWAGPFQIWTGSGQGSGQLFIPMKEKRRHPNKPIEQ